MTIIETIFLGIVQGLTEFIPISSSGHLLLLSEMLGINTSESSFIGFTIFVHVGTLLAALIFFRKELLKYMQILLKVIHLKSFKKLKTTDKTGLFEIKNIAIASTVTLIIAFFLRHTIQDFYENPENDLEVQKQIILITIIGLIIAGTIFLISTRIKIHRKNRIHNLPWYKTILIGLAQTIALFYGVSRSGSTLTMCHMVGLKKQDSVKYVFIISIPVILAGFIYEIYQVVTSAETLSNDLIVTYFIGFITAFISGYIAIKFLIEYLKHNSIAIFGVYCIGFAILSSVILLT